MCVITTTHTRTHTSTHTHTYTHDTYLEGCFVDLRTWHLNATHGHTEDKKGQEKEEDEDEEVNEGPFFENFHVPVKK